MCLTAGTESSSGKFHVDSGRHYSSYARHIGQLVNWSTFFTFFMHSCSFFLLFILLVHFCISLCLIVGYPLAFAMLICLSIWEQVHFKFELMQETLYLMVTLLDQYLSQVTIKKDEMQLVGLTALLLASKYEDFWHPRVNINISTSVHFSWFAFLCS